MRCSFRPRIERLECRLALAAFAVDSLLDTFAVDLATGKDADGHVTLRSALDAANSLGGSNTISVPSGLYKLSNHDLSVMSDVTITGASGTIVDGQQLSSVFYIQSGFHVTIANLTIQNGRARTGGGINNYGSLTLTGDTIANNAVVDIDGSSGMNGGAGLAGGPGGPAAGQAFGGGIFNFGDLTIIGCQITGNIAQGGKGGAGGNGGASTAPGANGQSGGLGGRGGSASGGGIENDGTLTIIDSVLANNQARGGDGGAGGSGSAGATGSTGFAGTLGQAGLPGGSGGNGGNGGGGGDGGFAFGAGIAGVGAAVIRSSTITGNLAVAGNGGINGSPGAGGSGGIGGAGGSGLATGQAGGSGGLGGAGGNAGGTSPAGRGGTGFGGGISIGGFNDSSFHVENSTLFGNIAQGGASGFTSLHNVAGGVGGRGGVGGNGAAQGAGGSGGLGGTGGAGASGMGQQAVGIGGAGAIDGNVNDGTLSLVQSCTIVGNSALALSGNGAGNPGAGGPGGAGGSGGSGMVPGASGATGSPGPAGTVSDSHPTTAASWGGIYSPLVDVRNSIVTGNTADSEPDASELGPNSAFNLIGQDAKLGPLQDNGGPTATMSLLAGSPAIGVGDPLLVGKFDQRGFLRRSPIDIGALQTNVANSAPSFLKGPDQHATDEDAAHVIIAWATKITAGPAFESTQAVDFVVSVDKPELFLAGPSINASGMLSFKPAPNVQGTAVVTVKIHDNGGTADGGVDVSPPQTFSIVLTKPHPWLNAARPLDVTADGHVVPGDALAIINQINAFGTGKLPTRSKFEAPYYDVNGDGSIAPNDALDVINAINAGTTGGEGEGVSSAADANGQRDSLTDVVALLASDMSAPSARVRRTRL